MMWSCNILLANMVANLFAKESEKRRQSANAYLENNLRQALLQHRVHFLDSAEKRPSRLHTRLMYFN